ncbi:MAG TPA: hypothetical protein VLT36_07355 [Candidatus Dormibacteraeota bacterium]|nr:hypothetical protein [Candidatus Dormibacteraeota bacterium]
MQNQKSYRQLRMSASSSGKVENRPLYDPFTCYAWKKPSGNWKSHSNFLSNPKNDFLVRTSASEVRAVSASVDFPSTANPPAGRRVPHVQTRQRDVLPP